VIAWGLREGGGRTKRREGEGVSSGMDEVDNHEKKTQWKRPERAEGKKKKKGKLQLGMKKKPNLNEE